MKCGTSLKPVVPVAPAPEAATPPSPTSTAAAAPPPVPVVPIPIPIVAPPPPVDPAVPPLPVQRASQEPQPIPAQAPAPRPVFPYGAVEQRPSIPQQASTPPMSAPKPQVDLSAINIWGPFAGYGTRRRHVGWLLDNRGDQVEALREKITQKFTERAIPGTNVTQQVLKGRGILVESRGYYLLRKGLITTGLYVTDFGRDLYLSLVSYIKSPISNVRILILGLMVVFWLFMSFLFPAVLNHTVTNFTNSMFGSLGGMFGSNTTAPSMGGLLTLLCVIGPLGLLNNILLLLFVVYSLWKFITAKDILAGLRVTPNEFNEDDLMGLEKAVEQTIRQSMDEIGLDFNLARQTTAPESRII